MPKRFTDTGIWVDKPWFIELSPAEKCAWFFIKDRCDSAGVWRPNHKMAEIVIGAPIDWAAFVQKCNSGKTRIEILDNGKWWLPDFIEYQYGELRDTCKPHQSYITLLKKHGLYERVMETQNIVVAGRTPQDVRVLGTLQEKEKEKELEKEKDKKDARVKILIDYFHDKYVAKTKQKPTVTGQWGRNFKVLLRAHTEETVKRVINAFFAYEKRRRFSFSDFMRSFDNILPFAMEARAGPVTLGTYVWGKCPDCGALIKNTAGICLCGHGR